ncbi:hypothetical protein OG948_36605 (plasmid) [Embleya sp. NBC_00888]|uniref:hypothetical protein n=1 Tax=Embleya sp. NBC_00888 TaxID=2975960 RepID=UPI002F90BC07|nr:hypothetical protein OG948_36605 [Embleya sp. NBC_00888]
MSAQPDHVPPRPAVPRTIRGVRRALDQEQRAAFEEELADAELGAVDDLLFLWWGIDRHVRARPAGDRGPAGCRRRYVGVSSGRSGLRRGPGLVRPDGRAVTYRIEYANPPQAELRAMDAKTRAAFDDGITAVARDPYGAGSKPYPGGGSDDHRITQVGGVAIIT